MESKKFCVFCGEKPHEKNKEHVLPKWLIEITGDPKRTINVGYNLYSPDSSKEPEMRKYSINCFTLPACEQCNSEFSSLEYMAKPIVESILNGDSVTSGDISILLDWLDKVRVGLWLMYFTLDKNPRGIIPKFHIKKRIGQQDRLVHISINSTSDKRMIFSGVQTLSFHMSPSVFALIINNVSLISASSMDLVSRRMGFPFFKSVSWMDGDRLRSDDVDWAGLQRVISPIMKNRIHVKGDSFYQAVYGHSSYLDDAGKPVPFLSENIEWSEYVVKNSIERGKSKIVSNSDESIFLEDSDTISIHPHYSYEEAYDFVTMIGDQVLKLQTWLDEVALREWDMQSLDPDQKSRLKRGLRFNIRFNKTLLSK